MNQTAILHQHCLLNTYPFRGKVFVKGEGNYLYDENQQKYLDLMTNYGVNLFGHNYPQINKAFKEQIDNLVNLHGSFANDIRAQAAAALIKACAGKVKKIYLANSGTEAIEAALKFALVSSGKKQIIAAQNAFHGKTLGALTVTYASKYKTNLPNLAKVDFVPYDDIQALKNKISKNTAAIVLEPIQGEAGVILPSTNYLKQVEDLCQKNNILLILDEIQTGCGRTGKFLAAHHHQVQADIICLGKGLAAGIPVGATLVTSEIAKKIPKAFQTSTFGGNPLACAGILKVLELLDQKMLDQISKLGKYFVKRLKILKKPNIKEIRGKGLMIGIEVKQNRDLILKKLQQHKILAIPAGEKVVRFLPPFTICKLEINQVIKVLCAVF